MKMMRWLILPVTLCALVASSVGAGTRVPIIIDPNTPVKDLLPPAPKGSPDAGPALNNDLSKVPEVAFQAKEKKDQEVPTTDRKLEVQIAAIHHLNGKGLDGFLKELLAERRDLQGIPFVMGDRCRKPRERSDQFDGALFDLRRHMAKGISTRVQADEFWENYRKVCSEEEAKRLKKNVRNFERLAPEYGVVRAWSIVALDMENQDQNTEERIAALMQVLTPESADVRLGLVKHLATIWHVASTRNLARMAIFSEEAEIRSVAVAALRQRPDRDSTEMLRQGLHYPWPAVARRTAEVVVKLERRDLIPELLDILESEDARAPRTKMVEGKKTVVVGELVKVNHLRNCLLCHSPGHGRANDVLIQIPTVALPVPGTPLSESNPGHFGYQAGGAHLTVRTDVTYLRQDFSRMELVADAAPWPEMQRFDYLVRTRAVSEEEARLYREKLAAREPGQRSPYHQAALFALRELTGKDTAPNAAAWRELLGKDAQRRR